MTAAATPAPVPVPVADLLRRGQRGFTRAERRIAEVLLAQYPMAGLQPVTRLAADAGVSTPTVLRLLAKLGFEGYGDFREALFAEIAAMLSSPVNRVVRGPASAVATLLERAEHELAAAVVDTVRGVDSDAFERAVAALADPGRRVLVGGGRMSWTVAAHMVSFLQMARPGVHPLGPESGGVLRARLDLDEQAVVVLFDFRTYQASTIALGEAARAAGAFVVVITDRYLSPLAGGATALLTTATDSPTPYDGMVGAFALVEVLAAATIERIGPEAQARAARFVALEQLDDHPSH